MNSTYTSMDSTGTCMMPDCGVDSCATCPQCGERRCARHYILGFHYVPGQQGKPLLVGSTPTIDVQLPFLAELDATLVNAYVAAEGACTRCREAAVERAAADRAGRVAGQVRAYLGAPSATALHALAGSGPYIAPADLRLVVAETFGHLQARHEVISVRLTVRKYRILGVVVLTRPTVMVTGRQPAALVSPRRYPVFSLSPNGDLLHWSDPGVWATLPTEGITDVTCLVPAGTVPKVRYVPREPPLRRHAHPSEIRLADRLTLPHPRLRMVSNAGWWDIEKILAETAAVPWQAAFHSGPHLGQQGLDRAIRRALPRRPSPSGAVAGRFLARLTALRGRLTAALTRGAEAGDGASGDGQANREARVRSSS